MPRYPGEYVDQVGSTVTGAVKGVVSSIGGGIRSAGDQLQSAVDQPFRMIGLKNSPLRIIHDPIDGVVRAVESGINHGVIEPLELVAGGITQGLDRVPETFADKLPRR